MTTHKNTQRFDTLMLPHLDAAYNLARWLSANDASAQDIAQKAMLHACNFFDGFHGDDGKSWLLAIVRNTYYSWLRKNRGRHSEEPFDKNIHGEDPALVDTLTHDNPKSLLTHQAGKRIIDQALERLPVEYREIIVLRELESLSYGEIANIVDVPIGDVASRLARARELLQAHLGRISENRIAACAGD